MKTDALHTALAVSLLLAGTALALAITPASAADTGTRSCREFSVDPGNRWSVGDTVFFRSDEGYRSGHNVRLATTSGKAIDLDLITFRASEQWREVWKLCAENADRRFGDGARDIFDWLAKLQ